MHFNQQVSGTTMEWCKSPDVGLPAPDVVFYLTLPAEVAQTRQEYGGERYEKTAFQSKVAQNFNALMDDSWHTLDASRSIEDIHTDVYKIVQEVIKEKAATPLEQLWTDQRTHTGNIYTKNV